MGSADFSHDGQPFRIRYSNCQKKMAATALIAGTSNPSKDIILLTEPYLGRRCNASFGSQWHINHNGASSRAIIATPSSLSATKLTQFSTPDAAFNLIELEDVEFILGCIYFAEGIVDEDRWSTLMEEIKGVNNNLLIFADTNAHSVLWGYTNSNAKGKIFEEILTESGLKVFTTGYFPSFHNSRNQESCIDIAFGTPGMEKWLTERIISEVPSLSDHAVWEIHLRNMNTPTGPPLGGFKFRSANWVNVCDKLQSKLSVLKPPDDSIKIGTDYVNRYVDQLVGIIKEIIRRYIPQSRPCQEAIWWNSELTHMKNRVLEGSMPLAEFEESIKKAKTEHWKKFIDTNSSLGDAYLRKRLCSLGAHNKLPSTVMKDDGSYTTSSEETASYLLSKWFRFPDNDADKHRFNGYYRSTLAKLDEMSTEDFQDFTEDEIMEVIASLKTESASGPDGIPTLFIQQTAAILVPHLCTIFNLSLGINHTPRMWKEGRVVLIPKSEGGYRPITLLPVFIKILERLVLKRLQVLEVSNNWMSPEQFAYRPGRSSNHALMNYVTVAGEYIKNKTPNCMIHIDIKGAFDNVWAPVLLNRLIEKKCPAYLLRWIADYMADRKQVIRINDFEVDCKVQKSSPQGGCLSPIFWNLIIDPLLLLLRKHANFVQAYADDLVFSVTATNWELVEIKANHVLRLVREWTSRARLTVNPSKSSAISFSARRKIPKIKLKIGEDKIGVTEKIKYLGLVIVRKLSWKAHLEFTAGKAMKALHFLSAIVKRNWGLDSMYVTALYKGAIEPILTYGAIAWCNATAKSEWMKPLRRVQRTAAKMAARVNNHAHSLDLLNVVGFLPIDLRIQELAHTAWCRGINSDDDPLYSTTSRLKKHDNSAHFSAVQQLQVWDRRLELTSSSIQTESSALICKLKKDTPRELFTEHEHSTSAGSSDGVVYYSDGSKSDDGTSAAYVMCSGGQIIDSWATSLHPDSSVFQAELTAIEAVLIDIDKSCTSVNNITIYSDSLSAISVLSHANRDKSIECIRRRLIRLGRHVNLKIGWVRGHSGVDGNELADSLAKAATKMRPEMLALPLSHSQAKLLIKRTANVDWSERWRTRYGCWSYNWMPTVNRRYKSPVMSNSLTSVFNSFICNVLPLRSKLHQWNIITSKYCYYHPGYSETPRHVLFECDHHAETRRLIKEYAMGKCGRPDLTFQGILKSPYCAGVLAEALLAHIAESKPFNDRLLVLRN